ncbi:hypothetical protein BKA69DRAFT_159580 [Paraphysoderma sedebokerense]|nr:hypothetical protein BKA69DRAFT_159580 [Paraphysoderma sedebokerense]
MSLISLCILLLGLLSALDSFVAAKSASSPTDLIIDAQSRLTNTWKSKDFVEVTSYLVVLTLSYRDPSTKVAVPYDERNVSIRPSVNTTFIIDEKGQTVEKVFSPTSPYVGVTNTFGRISFSIPLPDGKLKSPGLHVSAVPSSSKSHYLNRKEYLIYPDTDAIHQLANISPEIIKSLNANIDPKTSQATSQMIRHVMSMSLKSDLNLPKSRRRRRLAKRSTNPFETAFNDHQDETTYDEKTSSIFTWAVDYTPDNIRRILPKPRDTWSYHLSQTLVHNNYVASYAKGEYKLQKRKVGKTVDITAVNFDDSKIEVLGVEAVEKDQNGFIAILRDGIEGVVKTVVKSVKDAIEVVKKLFKTLGIELKSITSRHFSTGVL